MAGGAKNEKSWRSLCALCGRFQFNAAKAVLQ